MWMCLGVVFFSSLVFFWGGGVHCLLFLPITTLCRKPLISKAGGNAGCLPVSVSLCGFEHQSLFWPVLRVCSVLGACAHLKQLVVLLSFSLSVALSVQTVCSSVLGSGTPVWLSSSLLHFTELTLAGLKPTDSELHSGCQAG